MPSSPGYKRNYAEEKKTSDARGDMPRRAARDAARRELEKLGMVHKGDGEDVDHKKPLIKGGPKTALSNLRVETAHKNRSFPRNKHGGMK
jgi:hypothetical protein